MITRRACLKQISVALAANVFPLWPDSHWFAPTGTQTQQELAGSKRRALTKIGQRFLHEHNAPGLSVAISRHGQIVYAEGFGVADQATGERVTPSHLFRICSLSKPITSVAVYSLIEQGKLKLEDKVFGAQGVLGIDYPNIDRPFLKEITIHHLLTHTSGGWSNSTNDPMFAEVRMNHHELITWTLKNRPLKTKPGTHYAYSNFGYSILGRVLEKISGKSYEDFVRSTIFTKCGIQHMQLAGNTLGERARNEVVYDGQNGEDPYGMNVRRMDSHGGWIGTPSEMLQFAMHVDGLTSTTNILSKKSLDLMTTPTAANPNYASGWLVNKASTWWHDGNLPGSASFMVRTARGLCWAAFTNTRCPSLDLDILMWKMARAVPAWKA